jgi:diguanylate cyclase (GGDEF)-like protein
MRPLTDDGHAVTGAIASVSDVTESVRLREELHERATFDLLTRCLNRAAILSELDGLVQVEASSPSGLAVLFIDVDLFKAVNDRLGHAAGDELLTVVADRLRGTLRDDDLVGRLGGDEFLVVCPRVVDTEMARVVADRIADALSGEVTLRAGKAALRASIGVAWSASSDVTAARMVHEADLAMYESKRQRTGRPVLHEPSRSEAA